MAAPAKRTLNRDDCAEELGVHPETLKHYVAAGCPHSRGRGGNRFDAAEVMVWMKANGKTGKPGRPPETESSPDLEAARLRKENALASKYELQVQRERKSLLPAADVQRWIMEHIGAIRTRLSGLGDELTPALEGRDAPERAGIINARVRELLTELSANAGRLGADGTVAAPTV